MGIAIPQVVTEDRASGALVINGSSRFNKASKLHLIRTPTSAGNQKTWTLSFWFKKQNMGDQRVLFNSFTDNSNRVIIRFMSDKLQFALQTGGTFYGLQTNQVFRDNGWYHVVLVLDTTQNNESSRQRIYVNGDKISDGDLTHNSISGTNKYPTKDATFNTNTTVAHYIGANNESSTVQDTTFDGQISNVYLIDSQALGPENFGYTDPLTNTWRPKKYTGAFTRSSVNNGTNWTSSLSATSGSLSNGANAFDGNLSTRAQTANAAPGKELTFAPPAINFTTSLEVYCDQGSNVPTATWNGNTVNPGGGAWVTVYSGSGELSSTYPLVINTETAAQYATLKGVRIDGEILIDNLNDRGVNSFYLPMDGNSPIGEDKSGAPSLNDGTNWSSYFTGSHDASNGWANLYEGPNVFDGNLSTAAIGDENATGLTWTAPGGGIGADATTIRIYGNDDNCPDDYLKINGINYGGLITQGFGPDWTVLKGSGAVGAGITQLESVYLRDNDAGNTHYRWRGLEIDGVVLVDGQIGNSWTPVNFGGSVSIDNPIVSGARPILNTTQGGNAARPGVFGSDVSKIYAVTVASVDGGNKYHFDGVDRPNPTLIRGATYTFDQSDSSNGGGGTHPLRFATAADAAGSTEYTDGVATNGTPGQAGAYTKITVPHNAPDTLYYYCTNHGGMGSSTVQITDETKADKYASSLVLACPYAGDKEDISGEINCTVSNKTSDNYGSIQKFKTGAFYNSSRFFDGSNDNINYSSSSSLGLDGAFTIEMYATPSASNNGAPISSKGYYSANTGNWYFRFSNTGGGTISFYAYQQQSSGQEVAVTGTGRTNNDRMYHIVCQRDSSNLTSLLIDGVLVGQGTNLTHNLNDGASNGLSVGRISKNNSSQEGWAWHDGHIGDLRIYKGIAKYDVSGKIVGSQVFTPASANPDILPDSPSGAAAKSELKKNTDGAVSFDGSGDYLVIEHSDMAMGTEDFTVECFVYNRTNKNYNAFISTRETSNGTEAGFVIASNASGYFYVHSNGPLAGSYSGDLVLPLNQWCHIAYTRSSGTHRLFLNGVAATNSTTTSRNYTEDMLVIGDNGYAKDEPIDGFISNVRVIKGTALYTSNFIPPNRKLTNVTNTKLLCCQSTVEPGSAAVAPNVSGINNGTQWSHYLTGAGGFQGSYPASKAFNGTASASETSRSTNTGQTQTFAPPAGIPYSSKVEVWTYYTGDVSLNGGSNVAVADDQDWREIASGSGTLNTLDFICDPGNSMYLGGIRIDSTTILVDPSLAPNGDAATTNFNPFNTDINTVRGQEGAFATFNPIDHRRLTNGPTYTLSRGNLTCDMVGGTNHSSGSRGFAASTYTLPTGGKWYCEFYMDSLGNDDIALGIASDIVLGYYIAGGNPKPGAYMVRSSGIVYSPTFQLGSDSARAFTSNDLVGVSVDLESTDKRITFYKNGTAVYNTTVNEAQGPFKFVIGCDPGGSTAYKVTANFGQNPFKFLPSGDFQPLSSSSLRPDTVVSRSDQYVSTTLYTGNGASTPGGSGGTQNIDVKHKPDLIWIKDLTQSHNHNLVDSIRGPGSILMSDSDVVPVTNSTDAVTAFTDTGFTLGDNGEGTQSLELNKSGNSYVAWSWKAGGSSNTFNVDDIGYASAAAAGLTAGTITPTGASVGTKQGFSIIKWTDQDGVQQLPHGLSQAPDFILIKDLGSSVNWSVYHSSIGNALAVYLNNANAAFSTSRWDTKDPTSSIFYWSDNTSTNSQIAYCWHDVPGLQKFGKYEGLGGTANGSFVELGFRPAIVWVKNVDDGNANSHWCVFDNLRPGYNKSPAQNRLHLDAQEVEDPDRVDDGQGIDILSNGFRVRSNNWYETNASGNTYLYCAWAEAPAFNLFGAQSNAR